MDTNTALDLTSIICTVIQTLGTLGAAIGTALIAKFVIQKDIKPIFQSYSDKEYDLSDIIKKARFNIVIMGSSGYRILEEYGSTIEKKLNRNVSLYYLYLSEQQLLNMEKYRHGENAEADKKIYPYVKGKLEEWISRYNKDSSEQIKIREFSEFMTAAYVGVDIPFGDEHNRESPDAVIQVVLYQYGNSAKDSPLSYLSPKRDKAHFEGTVDSMAKIWEKSKAPSYVIQNKNNELRTHEEQAYNS